MGELGAKVITADFSRAVGSGERPVEAPKTAPAPGPRKTISAAPKAREELNSAPVTRPLTLVLYGLTLIIIALGWSIREDEYIVAEEGLGYWLGITGGSMMLMLVLYPLRKRVKFMRNLGATRHWFRAHMVLGILGPVLVLFHSNFTVGSVNGTVALAATLFIAGSGLVGRHLYSKIHYGLYGKKMTLEDLKKDMEARQSALALVLGYAPSLRERLQAFDDWALRPSRGLFGSVFKFLMAGLRGAVTHMTIRASLGRAIKVAAKRSGWTAREIRSRDNAAREHISEHIAAAVTVAEFNIYERVFALWHLFHTPLFILLVIVTLVHVAAVHLY